MLVADVEVDELRGEIEPAVVVAIPEPDALAALEERRVGGALDGPGKHGVVAVFLDDLLGVWVHGWCLSADLAGKYVRGSGWGKAMGGES